MDTPDRFRAGWPPAGDEHAAQVERCHLMGWTDGLPVLPPTPERVDALLGRWIERRHELIATLPPAQGEATLETIAANCVLAGCVPDHLPVVVAAVQAMAARRFNLDAAVTGVNSVSPVVVIDGPIVERLGFNSGAGAMTAGNRANGTVGRAVQLCIRNIGGAGLGGIDAATHGHPGKYSYLVAGSPTSPWEPLRTRLGFAAGDSIVTVYSAEAPLCIADMGHDDPLSILRRSPVRSPFPARTTRISARNSGWSSPRNMPLGWPEPASARTGSPPSFTITQASPPGNCEATVCTAS
ncbi:MAG: hypothetical protein OXF41_07545 [bacterium]|nr:hypothetical protein [bacterium]